MFCGEILTLYSMVLIIVIVKYYAQTVIEKNHIKIKKRLLKMYNIPVDKEFKEKVRKVLITFQIDETDPLNIVKKSLDLVLEMNADMERLLEMLLRHLEELSPELKNLVFSYLLKYFSLD